MSGLRKSLLLASVAVPAAAAASWCVLQEHLPSRSASWLWTLDVAAAFGDYPVFYLGEEFEGLPLAGGVIREVVADNPDSPGPIGRDGFIFVYGDYTIRGDNEGCAVPLSVEVMPRCYDPPEFIRGRVEQGPILAGPGGSEVQTIGNSTYVWTGEVTVGIGGGGASYERAVEALWAINSGAVGREAARLSPPNTGLCAHPRPRTREGAAGGRQCTRAQPAAQVAVDFAGSGRYDGFQTNGTRGSCEARTGGPSR
jgi:hypothetical protein